MRLIGKQKLQKLFFDDIACVWVQAWVAEVLSANWRQAADVCIQFPSVRQSSSNEFIFSVRNCDREIHLQIAFQQGIAVVTDLQ